MIRSRLLVIFLTVVIDLISFGIVIPLLPLYAQQFGASGAMIGLLLSAFSFMTFIGMPVLGRWSDRFGRRPVLLLSILGSVVAYVLFSMAHDLSLLFLSRILAGIANSNLSVAQAYIADMTAPEHRAKGMGMIGAAFGLGFIFGPMISAVFSAEYFGTFRLVLPGYIAAGLSLLNLVLAWYFLPESLPVENRRHDTQTPLFHWRGFFHTVRRPQLGPIVALFFFVTLAYSNIFVSLPLFVKEVPFRLSSAEVSWVFAEIGIVSAIVQGGLIGKLSALFGERRLVLVGTILIAVGFFGFPASTWMPAYHLWGLGLTTACLALGSSCFTPNIMSLVSQLTDPTEQGAVLGIVQSFAAFARMLGPTFGGTIYDMAGHASPYFFASALTCLTIPVAVSIFRHRT